jgi:hypothetical protein
MARHGEVLRWSSDSEQDTQLQTTRMHRKDNSAWGKRMEKELAAVERDERQKLSQRQRNKQTNIVKESLRMSQVQTRRRHAYRQDINKRAT